MGMLGLNTAISGLRAAQLGLGVTGHNMSNAEITGYSRQRVIQKDYAYTSVGMGANGNPLKRGMGTDWNAVSQIRNEFLDFSYRRDDYLHQIKNNVVSPDYAPQVSPKHFLLSDNHTFH